MDANFDFGIWDDWIIEEILPVEDPPVLDPPVDPPVLPSEDIDVSIDVFLAENNSLQTKYKDRAAEKRFEIFLKSLCPTDTRKIHEIPAKELDQIMCQFFMHAKKIDQKSTAELGELYQPDTLSSFKHAWQRILFERGCKFDIKNDATFERSRKVLAGRRKQLTNLGLGNKPLATRPLTDAEVDILYSAGYFGVDTPLTLSRNMWWKITTSFGYRARDESRKLKFGDIKLVRDENNVKYLEWDKERGSKTRTGERTNSHQRAFNPRAYATGDDRCPVRVYELFVSHRPLEACSEDSPFFLTMKQKIKSFDTVWFANGPLGKNKLGEFLSKTGDTLQARSSSRSKVANHSARKTSITSLLNNDVHPLHVTQLSGHKNLDSLKSYHTASDKKQKEMSDILNANTNPNTGELPNTGNTINSIVDTNSPLPVPPQVSNYSQLQSNIEGYSAFSFAGATITNCIFVKNLVTEPPKKKRYIISDSDEE